MRVGNLWIPKFLVVARYLSHCYFQPCQPGIRLFGFILKKDFDVIRNPCMQKANYFCHALLVKAFGYSALVAWAYNFFLRPVSTTPFLEFHEQAFVLARHFKTLAL